jgi:hypothetical protein
VSAFGGKADIGWTLINVRFDPKRTWQRLPWYNDRRLLDPKGKVIEFINMNEAFYGEATILGKPYLTGYEPVHDAQNNVIGIYYFGYLVRGSLTSQEQQTLKRLVKIRGCDGSEMDPDVSKAPYRPLRGVRGGYSRRLRKVLGTVN